MNYQQLLLKQIDLKKHWAATGTDPGLRCIRILFVHVCIRKSKLCFCSVHECGIILSQKVPYVT